MKKFLSLLLVTMLMLSLAACGASSSKPAENSTANITDNAQTADNTQTADPTLDYPTSPITLYCPWAPGGSSDLMCRQISSLFSKYSKGATVNVVNREGGNGAVCLGEIAQGSGNDDGYTMSFAADATLSINPYVNELLYSTDDFTIVGAVAAEYVGLFARSDSEFNSLQDIVDYYAASGEVLKHGQSGSYSRNHLTSMVMFQNMGVKEEIVSYGGASEAIAALLGGDIEFVLVAPGQALPYLESGDMKGIAMLSETRASAFPDIATVKEQGFGDVSAVANRIVVVPSSTDPEIVAYLRDVFAQLAADQEWKEFLETNGIMECEWTAEDLQAHLPEETLALWDVMESLDLLVDSAEKPAA